MQREPHSRWARGRDLQAELEQKIAHAELYARRPQPISVPLRQPRGRTFRKRPSVECLSTVERFSAEPENR
eukprot:3384056-Pleurochrysis_carterae.AAC.2